MLLRDKSFVHATNRELLCLILFGGSETSVLRGSWRLFRLTSFNSPRNWLDPLFLISTGKHANRNLHNALRWIGSKPSILTVSHIIKNVNTFKMHSLLRSRVQMTSNGSLNAKTRLLFMLCLLFSGLTQGFLIWSIAIWAHINHNSDVLFSNVSAEFLNEIFPLLLQLRHFVEHPRYLIFIWTISGSTHARRRDRNSPTMFPILLLSRIRQLMWNTLIDIF